MPPWHVDRTVGIRKFKDDPSLTRRGDRDDRRVGRRRRAARQPGRHAAAAAVRRRRPLAHRQARSHRVDAEDVHREARGGRLVGHLHGGLRPDRGPLHQGGRSEAVTWRARASCTTRSSRSCYDDGTSGGGTLVEYAVGKNGDVFPEGSGKLMKAGAKVRFNMHYHSVGEAGHGSHARSASCSIRRAYVPKHVITTILVAEPGRPRHSGRRRQRPQRRVLQDGEAVAPRRLHAAHAQPRQAPVPRGDLSRTCASSS